MDDVNWAMIAFFSPWFGAIVIWIVQALGN